MDDNKTPVKRIRAVANISRAVKQLTRSDQALYCYLGLYFLVNLLFLTAFPYVHSDES